LPPFPPSRRARPAVGKQGGAPGGGLPSRPPAGRRSRRMVAPTVVFDLDGTLVDSAPDLVATLNTIFARNGLPPVTYDSARNMVGGGARAMIGRGLAAEGRTLEEAEVDRL